MKQKTGQLIALPYSPWSEKARWALDHHSIPYRESEYAPLFGMPLLRWKTKKFRGRLTVPIFLQDGRVLTDSWDIARHAERSGKGDTLFPTRRQSEIREWNERGERCLRAGRALLLQRVSRDRPAQSEYLPRAIPKRLRLWFGPATAAVGMGYFRRKYQIQTIPEAELENRIALELESLRQTLADAGPYICGRFSYADIAMSMVLQFVEPVGNDYLRLGAHGRPCWRSPNLIRRFGDLIAWRDDLYRRHRRGEPAAEPPRPCS